MPNLLHRMTCGALLALAGSALAPASVKAAEVPDPYWRRHWTWYDSTYGPYYRRYYTPGYVYPSHPLPNYTATPYYLPPPVRTYEEPVPGQPGVRYGWW